MCADITKKGELEARKLFNTFFSNQIGCLSSNPSWIGDGFCDDETNNAGCHFDGGDCCGTNANTQWCDECICY